MFAPRRAFSIVPASVAERRVKAGVYSVLLANITMTAISATEPSAAPMMPSRWVMLSCLRTDWTCSFIDQSPLQLGPHDFLIGLDELVADVDRGLQADRGFLHLEHHGVEI